VHQPVKRSFFTGWTRTSLRRAARCVVPSYATLDELTRVTGGVRDQVDVAHHGVDPDTFHLPDPACVAKVREHLGLRAKRYVAFLGTIEPRKNVPFLIEGWRRAVQGFDEPPALVVAGGRGWDTRVDEVLSTVPERLEVLLPGYLPLEMLAGFLGGAEAVLYPSIGEGFGLPVLEAMACGAPVITTTSLALPEVGGDAVAYTDPTAAGIAATLVSLLADGARRRELSSAALTRAGSFTWTACAEQHLRTYARAVAA
jgi:glycosyltransferase involved in cell wall biosynthesis